MPPGQQRQGSAESRTLFEKAVDATCVREWERFDAAYHRALSLVATSKKRPELLELDAFIHNELPSLVKQRSPPHFLHAEIAQVTKWKLTRGKFRPLQKMVEGNAASAVISATTKSLQALNDGHWEDALDALTQLRGVGVATASAVLAIISPTDCPFMADEVLEGTINSRDYTMRAYTSMRTALVKKAKELPEGWTAERVGRAMWTCAMLASFSVVIDDDDVPAEEVSKPRDTATATTAASTSSASGRKRRQHVPPSAADNDAAVDDVRDTAAATTTSGTKSPPPSQSGTTKRRRINTH